MSVTAAAVRPPCCLRCDRHLHATASVTAGYGPGCQAKIRATAAAAAGFTPAQADRELELLADGGVARAGRPGVYRVVSSDGQRTYLTTPAGQCSCPAAVKSGRASRCYHVLAARSLTGRKG